MYASAWIFVSAPIVVSFSTSEPRPTTTSSPIVTRSRMHAWSPTTTRAPSRVPANTIAPVEMTVPGPSSAGPSGSRLAVERGARSGGNGGKRVLELLENADDREPVLRRPPRVAAAGDEVEERFALEPEGLVRRDLRAELVACARPPLAVAAGGLPRRLLVDRHPLLERHFV